MIVGAVTLIVINTLLYGFVTWLPTFFVQQDSVCQIVPLFTGHGAGRALGSTIGALTADCWGRKPTIVGASLHHNTDRQRLSVHHDPSILLAVGFSLIVPIYVLVALLFAIYIPELFPTEVRLRASGICNTFGRGAIIFMPFVVVALFRSYGVAGVLVFMNALLIVQIAVVLTLGVEPKKRRLEEIDAEATAAALPAEVRDS